MQKSVVVALVLMLCRAAAADLGTRSIGLPALSPSLSSLEFLSTHFLAHLPASTPASEEVLSASIAARLYQSSEERTLPPAIVPDIMTAQAPARQPKWVELLSTEVALLFVNPIEMTKLRRR